MLASYDNKKLEDSPTRKYIKKEHGYEKNNNNEYTS